MRVAVFSTKNYDRTYLTAANAVHGHDLVFFEPRLCVETARLAGNDNPIWPHRDDPIWLHPRPFS